MQRISTQHRYEREEYTAQNEKDFEYREVEFRNTEITDGDQVKETISIS